MRRRAPFLPADADARPAPQIDCEPFTLDLTTRTLRDRLIDKCVVIGTAVAVAIAFAMVIVPTIVAFIQQTPA
jgi:hypothetical protein